MADEPVELPDLRPLQTAVGKGITAFANLEFAVGMCFASMLEPAPCKSSVAVINAIRTFEAKMKIADALAAVALETSHLTTWRNLSDKINKRADVRNKLAHWMVSHYPGASSLEEIKQMKPALVPPVWHNYHMAVMWDPKTNRKAKPLFLEQVQEFEDAVHKLVHDLLTFSDAIRSTRHSA